MPGIEPGAAGGEARMLPIVLFLISLAGSTLIVMICSWADKLVYMDTSCSWTSQKKAGSKEKMQKTSQG